MKIGLLIGGLFLALLVAMVVTIDLVRTPNQYSVQGEATIKFMPDAAEVEASVIHSSDVSTDAARAVADDMRNVLQALKSAGVADDDIASRGVELHSQLLEQENGRTNVKPASIYIAGQTIVVSLHDLSMVSKITGIISDNGSNHWRVAFFAKDRAKLLEQATKAAFADAIRKADIYAAAGGFKRGAVLKMTDSPGGFQDKFRRFEFDTNSLEEIVVTARRREETTNFVIPKPEEQKLDASVALIVEID
jgi:uncharacterized protein YggE